MSYPHYSTDCHEYHARVIDFPPEAVRPRVITLCGSTRFKAEFERIAAQLTSDGVVVLGPAVFAHSVPEHAAILRNNPGTKEVLDTLHFRKIDMSDAIVVVNVNDYVGESTQREIDYAMATQKSIYWQYPRTTYTEGTTEQ